MAKHPVFYCVFHDRIAYVKRLVKAEPELVKQFGNALLAQAAARNGVLSASFLLDNGVNLNRKSGGTWLPIVWASYRGHLKMVRLLINRGAGVTRKHGNPIHYAGQRGHREVCSLLVAAGAIEGVISRLSAQAQALFRAAYSYDHETVERLLLANPDIIHAVDKDGRTALHEACTHGDTRTVKSLLKHGADAHAKDKNGDTPIVRAEKHGKRRLVQLLNGA